VIINWPFSISMGEKSWANCCLVSLLQWGSCWMAVSGVMACRAGLVGIDMVLGIGFSQTKVSVNGFALVKILYQPSGLLYQMLYFL